MASYQFPEPSRWRLALVGFLVVAAALSGCGSNKQNPDDVLPIYRKTGPGIGGDTLYQTVPDFVMVNQDSQVVTADSLRGKIHVANFFFATCPTVCPKMNANMARMQQRLAGVPQLRLVSYTIDPEQDTLEALQAYADQFDVQSGRWHLLRGGQAQTFALAQEGYKLPAAQDLEAPGGLYHSDMLVLVDPELRVRGYYKGVKDEIGEPHLDKLEKDVRALAKAYDLQADTPAEN